MSLHENDYNIIKQNHKKPSKTNHNKANLQTRRTNYLFIAREGEMDTCSELGVDT